MLQSKCFQGEGLTFFLRLSFFILYTATFITFIVNKVVQQYEGIIKSVVALLWSCQPFLGQISLHLAHGSENPLNQEALITTFPLLSLPTLFPHPLCPLLFLCSSAPIPSPCSLYLFFFLLLFFFCLPIMFLSTYLPHLFLYLLLSVELMGELSCCN